MERPRSVSAAATKVRSTRLIKAPVWECIAIFAFGVAFAAALLVLAIVFPAPTPFQYTVFRVLLALAAGGVAALLPGFLEVRYKSILRAGGAFAAFAVIYFCNPAALVATPPQNNIGNVTDNGNIITQGQAGGTNTIVNQNVQLVFESQTLAQEVWTEVELKDVPPGYAEYALLRFSAPQGLIIGRARIKGSPYTSTFFTDVNNNTPIAVRNVFATTEGLYKIPTILEFSIIQKPLPDAKLQIYTVGWVEAQRMIPHP